MKKKENEKEKEFEFENQPGSFIKTPDGRIIPNYDDEVMSEQYKDKKEVKENVSE